METPDIARLEQWLDAITIALCGGDEILRSTAIDLGCARSRYYKNKKTDAPSGALNKLVADWRAEAERLRWLNDGCAQGHSKARLMCANELENVLKYGKP